MGSSTRVTQEEFRLIKKKLWVHRNPEVVALLVNRSPALVHKVHAARDFDQYQKMVKAEHPPVKNSMKDRMAEIERWREQEVDPYLEHEQRKQTELAREVNGE